MTDSSRHRRHETRSTTTRSSNRRVGVEQHERTKRSIAEGAGSGEGITLSPNSVDTQIDSLLITFENKSTMTDAEQDFEECFNHGLVDGLRLFERYLSEADDADDADSVTSSASQKTDEPADPLTPKIDINSYAGDVAMLIETYSKRLDVETVIYNRARNYIVKNHGDDAAVQFDNVLINDHDINLQGKTDTSHLNAIAPAAKGAGPAL